MIIDSHMHILTGSPGMENLPARYRWIISMMWAYGGKPPYDRNPEDFFAKAEERISDPSGEYTIQTLDQGEVDGAILIPSDYGLALGDDQPLPIDEVHRTIGELQKVYPDRLFGFASGDVRRPNALAGFERAIQEYGLKGMKVMPHLGYYASDRMLYPYYERCQEWEIPVAICTNMEWTTCRTRFNEPLHIGDVVTDFPDLNVIIFHVGFPLESWFDQCMMTAVASLNVHFQFDAWVYPSFAPLQKGYTNILNDEQSVVRRLARARDVIGSHRILFGTDQNCGPSAYGEKLYNGRGYKWLVDWWRNLPATAAKYDIEFTQDDVDLMLGDNAARLVGAIDAPEYQRSHKYDWTVRTPPPRSLPT